MSRRRSKRSETVRPAAAYVREELGGLAALSARADLCWLARHQRDVAAREAGTGKALTGMPVHRSTEPRLPGALDLPDLSGEIARQLDTLKHELLDVGIEVTGRTEAERWLQAALVVDKVCTTDLDAMAWWDTASALRARAERVLGPDAHGRWLGPCAVPDCGGEVRLGDDQHAAVCPECGIFVTREQQQDYLTEEFQNRLMTGSEIASALELARVPVPYSTLRRWIATGRLPEHMEFVGIPWALRPSGLYRFRHAFEMAGRRHGIKAA